MNRFIPIIAAIFAAAISVDARGETIGQPWTGEPGIVESVERIMARDAATRGARAPRQRHVHPRHTPKNATAVASAPVPAPISPRAAAPINSSFLAVTRNSSGALPPDTMGAVGPTQIFVCLNGRFRLFNRSGNVISTLDVDSDVFFDSVRNGALTTDPRVHFDRVSNRWFISMLTEATVNRVLLAVSSGPTIADTTSFTFFQFQHDFNTLATDIDHNGFADYDTLGIDPNALYIGVSIFASISGLQKGATGFVVNKQALMAGTLTVTPFRDMSMAGSAGIQTPYGVNNADPNATEGYFVGTDNISSTVLNVLRVSNPGGTPTLSAAMPITVPDTGANSLGGVPALGSTRPIDDNDDRLFQAAMRNGSLYTAQNIEVDANGVAKMGGGRDGARWYEIVNLTTTPTVRQSGTLFDNAATSPRSYFFPTCAVNGQGHMVLGSSVAGANEHIEAIVTSRLAGDPLGALQPPVLAVASTTTYNDGRTSTTQRWGDYSATVVDPNDNMTFWTFQEYCVMQDVWGVQAIQVQAPPPATPTSCTPSSISASAANVTVTVTGDTINGAGFYEPGAAFPQHLGASVNSSDCVVNSVAFVDASHIQINLTTTNAAPGARIITVTNPDGQTVSSALGVLCIAPSGAPVLAGLKATGPLAVQSGVAFPFEVSGVDLCGATVPNYSGTVRFTSGDPGATLPRSYGFQPSDNGTRMFMATLKQVGDITVTAIDDVNGFMGSFMINVSSGPMLSARPSATPNPAVIGGTVSFAVTATEMPAAALTYAWDFGDGATAAVLSPTHAFANAGTFNVTVVITDPAGGTAKAGVIVAVTSPPAFISAPTATPNPGGVGQSIQFNAAATEMSTDTLRYAWDFGDGATAQGAAPFHVFATAGTYATVVTVSDSRGGMTGATLPVMVKDPIVGIGLDSDGDGFSDGFEIVCGTDPFNAKSTPLNGLPAGTPLPLSVQKLQVQLYFVSTGSDAIMLSGTLPVTAGLVVPGITVSVDVSGVAHVFKLDAHGKSKDGFTLQVKSSKGSVPAQNAKFSMNLQKGKFASTLASSGLKNINADKVPVTLTVSVVFNGHVFQMPLKQSYSAMLGRSGRSK